MSDWQTTKCIPSLQRPRLCRQPGFFNLTEPPVRLVRTGAHRGRAGASLPSGLVPDQLSLSLSLCRCRSAVHLAGMRAQRRGAGCSGSSTSLHGRNLSFFTRDEAFYEVKWVSPKMKRHKSAVINLLVRLLQLSPVEDIWTADWLMPAVRRVSRASLFLPALLSAFQRGLLKTLLRYLKQAFFSEG